MAYPDRVTRTQTDRPSGVTATVFHALGFDPDTVVRDQLDRPVPISAGEPIRALFG